MKILLTGDTIGNYGVEFMQKKLNKIKRKYDIDFCIVNAENSASNGITPAIGKALVDAGADCITMGNHTFNRYEDFCDCVGMGLPIVRPANYPSDSVGKGYLLIEWQDITIAVVNIVGRVFLDPVDCPFKAMDRVLKQLENRAQVVLVDFHAEATSEKIAMKYHLDGRVSALVGTHTHVVTADEHVTENGMAYITDLGMTGPTNSILGVNKDVVLRRFIEHVSAPKLPGEGEVVLNGVVIDIDEYSGRANSIERISER
ncbi:MAG: TIGR00282 family metallophosphoesterase [Clostridiales bacterium]|jgi:metallophosphoesterase (TIGR00282 family)|nr:TIGR00282 family metallophosphoesterase [Clostridiales bacterium]